MLVIKSCEAYGRFALHKEASKDAQPRFSLQARTLLDWTTERVIPVLCEQTRGQATPFGELNISRISAASASPIQPASPTPMPPPRQRVNRNSTPGKDGSFGSVTVDISPKPDSTALLSHGLAVALLQSSCLIFSDWLKVGGTGSEIIATSACNWCAIFSQAKNKAALQTELLPAFTHLMFQLCVTGSDFTVLEKLIASCDDIESEDEEANLSDKTISKLVKGRDVDGNPLTDGVVDAVLGAARSLVEKKQTNDENQEVTPHSLSDLWDIEEGSVFAALSAVMSNKQASLALARRLVVRFNGITGEGNQNAVALFEAKLLALLLEKTSGTNAAEMNVLVATLDAEKFSFDDAVRGVLRNVTESLVA